MTFLDAGQLVATCAGGLEPVVEAELRALGFTVIGIETGAVRFAGRAVEIVRANARLRSASRVLVPLCRSDASDYDAIYRVITRLPWERLLPTRFSFVVSAVTKGQRVRDSRYAAVRVKDAVVDRQRERTGERSSVSRTKADVSLVLYAGDTGFELSVDSSGEPLHVRGYRTAAGDAPLRETLAAGLLLLAGWPTAAGAPEGAAGVAQGAAGLSARGSTAAGAPEGAAGVAMGAGGAAMGAGGAPEGAAGLPARGSTAAGGVPRATGGAPPAAGGVSRATGGAHPAAGGVSRATGGAHPAPVFWDPFCGSGTIAIEAALMASGITPGQLREHFGYEHWPVPPAGGRPGAGGDSGGANASGARGISGGASGARGGAAPPRRAELARGVRVIASDIDPRMVDIARANAARAGVEHLIEFRVADAREIGPDAPHGIIVTNPPYGERLAGREAAAIDALYERFGAVLKDRFRGWDAWLFTANRAAAKHVGLRAARRIPLFNGSLECRLLHYPLYGRSR